jgi:anti-anti-sigma factor
MAQESRLVIPGRLEEVREACSFVVEAAEAAGLDERAVYHCQMAVDEALTNIIEHGHHMQGDNRQITLACRIDAEHFIIGIIDDSPAFNPLDYETADPSATLDQREPGGWGIYFIRKLMDRVTYERIDDQNHLTLYKRLAVTELGMVLSGDDGDTFPTRTLDDGAVVITPSGRLDSSTGPRLEQTLQHLLDQERTRLYVDMADVEYIASSGLKLLVSAWRRAQAAGGNVVLSSLQPRIVEIFEMVGFDMLFDIFPDLDTALAGQSRKS